MGVGGEEGGSYLRKHGMEDLGGSFLGLEPDGVAILLLGQHSQCHCTPHKTAQVPTFAVQTTNLLASIIKLEGRVEFEGI